MSWLKTKEDPILKDWQLKLLEDENVMKDEFLKHCSIKKLSEMNELSYKHSLKFYTKFSYEEQCDFWMDKVFEGVYELDINNADYL